MKTPFARVLFFIIMFVSVTVLSWWLSAVLLILLTIYFPFYLEIIFFGFLLDVLYLPKLGLWYPATVIATVLLLVISFVKTRVRS